MNILGVRIDNLSKKEILEKIGFFLNEDKFHQISTVNPDFILKSKKDDALKEILNGCDLNVADGVGIWYAFIRNFGFLKKRMAGVDLLEEILFIANYKKLNVYLAINGSGLSKFSEIKKVLEKKYPKIKFAGRNFYNLDLTYKIRDTKYQILICNFGCPWQEKFLNYQKNFSSECLQNGLYQGKIKLAIGVGGSFDFMTRKVKRAPKPMRFLGLEWLWRMFFHPSTNGKFILKRIRRIFESVIVFPVRVTIGK